ncbi:NAD(P)-binding oxidoreductase [Agrobacterium vitis]|uniref:SDR family oxidoreductase n=1 Tax=Agrobacterium vitis TaxID=373 RepID=A0AAE2UUA9_AGRVI|nr:SDR family oxidoreductase [Agrobacterium vitis]MUZ66375.1 NAD(P)H-binding protein [Agrobacterium vitis]
MKVIILGAAGNLGRRLVSRGLANGHDVTAFVRDRTRFEQAWGLPEPWPFKVVVGDATDSTGLHQAILGHDALVNAAGNVTEGESFASLVSAVVNVGEQALPAPHRMWFLAGAALLNVPHTERVGVALPGVPPIYRWHEVNWRRLERSRADWSLMCPGPMIASFPGLPRPDLRVSLDELPYPVGRWTRWVPGLVLALMMKARLPELIVSYEDVAELLMSNLQSGGVTSRRRVGVALPEGERGFKHGWVPGQRGTA